MRKFAVVVNPKSAHSAAGRKWEEIETLLAARVRDYSIFFTKAPGDATGLTRNALHDGFDTVVAVGGDGTINEVVNGFFENGLPVNPRAAFGIIPLGTGGDFVRTAGISKNVGSALETLTAGRSTSVDVGKCTFRGYSGEMEERFFLNIADIGLGGETVDRVNRSSKRFGGFLSFLYGSFMALIQYRNKRVRFAVDGGDAREEVLNSLIVANGQYFGGGMWIAPEARIDDGLFDVVILGNYNLLSSLLKFPRIYSGSHLKLSGVRHFTAKKIEVASSERVLLDIDGEQPGVAPVTFEILPGSLDLVVSASYTGSR